jgi:hypothetical protein
VKTLAFIIAGAAICFMIEVAVVAWKMKTSTDPSLGGAYLVAAVLWAIPSCMIGAIAGATIRYLTK